MVYIVYLLVLIAIVFFTPFWDKLIDWFIKNTILMAILSIFGDALYMVGGGILASYLFTIGVDKATLLTIIQNSGTIMIIAGATIREFFKRFSSK